MGDGAERRSEPRVSFRAKVAIRFEGRAPIETYSINLSLGGMSVELLEAPKVGTKLTVGLELSDGMPVTIQGNARHATTVTALSAGIERSVRVLLGIQFVDVKPEVARLLKEALEELEED